MCIDNSIKQGAKQGSLLEYGAAYTVIDQYPCWHGPHQGKLVYLLQEVDPNIYQFLASRFAPLSDIDELELIEQRLCTA